MSARVAGLPALALVLVAGVLGIQLSQGGGSFEPLRSIDPCSIRDSGTAIDDIDTLTERLVLLGLAGAACRLHVSREALTLRLARGGTPSDVEVTALRAGLLSAVTQLRDDDSLPPSSELVDEALDSADLSVFVKAAIRALPDSVVDNALHTDDVLAHTVDDLDLRSVLASLDDQSDLQQQVNAAVTQAVRQTLVDRVRGLL